MKKAPPGEVVNPFSDKFLETWYLWKEYRVEKDNFKYKGCISEQMAIKHLVDLSDGEEEKAIKIIEQSIRRQWAGFFPLHETTSSNGKSKQSASNGKPEPSVSLREQAINEFNNRNGGGEQQGDSDYLKAV